MDVSNTVLILAVRLLNVYQLLCPEWVSERHSATLSTVRERESRPQRCESWVSDSATWFTSWRPSFANDLLRMWITFALSLNHIRKREWRRERDSRPQQVVRERSVEDVNHVHAVTESACNERPAQNHVCECEWLLLCSKITTTRLRPTQHYVECVAITPCNTDVLSYSG